MKTKRLIHSILDHITYGHLTLTDPEGTYTFGNESSELQATMVIKNFQTYDKIINKGSLGLGESYMDGDWQSDNVANLVGLFLGNNLADHIRHSLKLQLAIAWQHLKTLPSNALQSQKNVAHHYDLGNDFYKLWLDETMTYTSGYVPEADDITTVDLETMQHNKLDRAFEQLKLKPGQTVLDIGCGWGGLLIRAAKKHGVRGVGITLSTEQHAEAIARVEQAGLADAIEIRLQDYREVPEQYDAVTSIEMAEAVGKKHFPEYIQKIHNYLKPGGKALLQIITTAKGNDPFILKHIFPGGYLPTFAEVTNPADKVGLILQSAYNMRKSYARTLQLWHERFVAQYDTIKNLSSEYTESFMRMWTYYLQICEAGFTQGNVHVFQFLFAKHSNRA